VRDVVCDASIVLKCFDDEDDQEVEEGRKLLAADRAGLLTITTQLSLVIPTRPAL
jgi:hypothetical protein